MRLMQKFSPRSKSTNVPSGQICAPQLLAGDDLARAAGQDGEHLQRLMLQADEDAVAAQLAADRIQLEGAESQHQCAGPSRTAFMNRSSVASV